MYIQGLAQHIHSIYMLIVLKIHVQHFQTEEIFFPVYTLPLRDEFDVRCRPSKMSLTKQILPSLEEMSEFSKEQVHKLAFCITITAEKKLSMYCKENCNSTEAISIIKLLFQGEFPATIL